MGFETLFYCKIVKAPLKVRRRVQGGKLQESSAQVATSQSCCVWIYFGLPLTARVGLFCRLDFAIDPPTHNGRKSLILAPQEIPDISGYQWGFGCQFVKAYITENPVTNQKIL